MKDLIGFVATLIEASGATVRRHSAASAMLVVAAGTIVGLGAIGVVICLLTSLWLYEQPIVGEVLAPLIVAGALALVTAIAAFVVRVKTRPDEAAPPPSPLNIGAVINVAESVMKSNKMLVLLGAGLLGLAAGESNSNNRR